MKNAVGNNENFYISVDELVDGLDKSRREKLIEGLDFKNFAKIFEDGETMRTVNAFLVNGMNVSRAAKQLFMHRNTMIYRLKAIRKLTGLDLYNFDMAVTFMILNKLYRTNRGD